MLLPNEREAGSESEDSSLRSLQHIGFIHHLEDNNHRPQMAGEHYEFAYDIAITGIVISVISE